MPYTLDLAPAAVRDLKRLPRNVQPVVSAAISDLAADPRPRGCEKIEGSQDLYRIRSGDYRIIYEISDNIITVLVLRIGHRRDIYRRISDLKNSPRR